MSSPEQLVRELADIPELLAAQVVAGLSREEVVEALFRSWSSRLSNITGRMNEKGKTMLTQAISQGPWSEPQVKDLASIVLQGGLKSKCTAASRRRNNQKIMNIENYIDINTMVKLRNHTTYSRLSRASMIAKEARSLGVELPDLPSLFRMVALLAYTEDNWQLSQEEVWSLMDRIQEYIKSVPRNVSTPWLDNFPVSAAELPQEMISMLYPDGNLPVVVEMPELDAVLKGHKMKGRDVNSAKKTPSWLNSVPEEHRDAVLAALRGYPSASPTSRPSVDAIMPATPPHSPRTGHTADIFRFSRSSQIVTAAAVVKPTIEPIAEPKSEQEEANDEKAKDEHEEDDDDIDKFEASLLAALHSRPKSGKGAKMESKGALMKKPSAADKAAVKKRPAAANKTTGGAALKRPAAADKKPAAKTSNRKVPKSSTWKLVHSRIYKSVRERHFAKNGDDEKAKHVARLACKTAKAKFMAGTLKPG